MNANTYFENETNIVSELEQKATEGMKIVKEIHSYLQFVDACGVEREKELKKEWKTSGFAEFDDFLRTKIILLGQKLEHLTKDVITRLQWTDYVAGKNVSTFHFEKEDQTLTTLDKKYQNMHTFGFTKEEITMLEKTGFEMRYHFVSFGRTVMKLNQFGKELPNFIATDTLNQIEKDIAERVQLPPFRVKQLELVHYIYTKFFKEMQ